LALYKPKPLGDSFRAMNPKSTSELSPQNIWCVGRNYSEHAKEMNAPAPTEPFIFLKSGGCLDLSNQIVIPTFTQDLHHEVEVVFEIDENLRPSNYGLGIDLTARDVQSIAKKEGKPWTLAKSFTGSCKIAFLSKVVELTEVESTWFSLKNNGEIRQRGKLQDALFDIGQIVDFLTPRFPIKKGDIVMTGTPSGVSALKKGDCVELYWNESKVADWGVI